MKGVGISVVDAVPKELIYMSMQNIAAELNQSCKEDTLEFVVGDFQVRITTTNLKC